MTLINSTTVLIPFTLEGVPILRYIVTIASTTSVTNVTVNNTSLYYPCHEPSTVVAINGAGDGYPAILSKLIHPLPSGKSHYFLSEDTCIQICMYMYMYSTFSSDNIAFLLDICFVTMITMGVPGIHLCIWFNCVFMILRAQVTFQLEIGVSSLYYSNLSMCSQLEWPQNDFIWLSMLCKHGFHTLCMYAQQGYVFGCVGLCIL